MQSVQPIRLSVDAPAVVQAYQLARVARAAYRNEPTADPAFRDSFDSVVTFRSTRVFGLVAAQGEDVVVAFRGTHEDREWIEALAYGQAPWGCGRAHKGCTRLVDNIWTNLLAALYDEDANARRLWLTGHSIGGTLALVAASKLEHEGFDVYNVTTFGSPAVLDRRAAESFRCKVYRVVNNEDVVADLPWPTLLDSYVHAGERILLTASGRVAAPHHSDDLARRIDRANALGEGIHPSGAFYDHSMESYLAKLKALGTNEFRESTEP